MTRVLFITNGHGEVSIAERIASELRALGSFVTDHFPLVGPGHGASDFTDVGPRSAMPSGGLIAMGNVRAFAADLRAGFLRLLGSQITFASRARGRYAAVVAVGDVYALLFARIVCGPALFVGTAKSVFVAPYGPGERLVLRCARRVFVRDRATAAALQQSGVPAEAPGNVIVDLLATDARVQWPAATERIALLPGSRERAYSDAQLLADVVRRLARQVPSCAAVLSIAPGLDPTRFAPVLAGQPPIAVWRGDLGALLANATLALGQAGTANEAAAACGIPVVAVDFDGARKSAWYRMRQTRLLGDALAVVPGHPQQAADAVAALLADQPRREHMARVGRERMGAAGGAAAIARAIATLASSPQ